MSSRGVTTSLRTADIRITLRTGLELFAIGVAYLALAKLGLTLASINPSATPIWPPTGFAIAALLLWGMRAWPVIFIAALIANATTAGTVATSAAIAVGNTLEGVTIAWLVERWCGGTKTFDTPGRVLAFATICGTTGTVLSATVGVATLCVSGLAGWSAAAQIWSTWWLGNLAGALVVAPLVIVWALPTQRGDRRNPVSLYGGTVAVGLIAFSPLPGHAVEHLPLSFLAVLPLLWAGLRYGRRETMTVAVTLSAFALWGTLAGVGPFVADTLNESVLRVIAFIMATTVPSLALAAEVLVRRRVEEDVRGQAKNLRAMFEQALVGINETDPEGRVLNVNERFCEIMGRTASELLGRRMQDFTDPEDLTRDDAQYRAVGIHGGGFAVDKRYVRSDGTRVWVRNNVSAITDQNGKVVRLLSVSEDVTERRRLRDDLERRVAERTAALEEAREQLFQAQKLEAIGQLTGGVAHDFNNILAVVLSSVEVIQRHLDDKPLVRRMLQLLVKAARRGDGVVRQLLIFSRRGPTRVEVLVLAPHLHDTFDLLDRLLGEILAVKLDVADNLCCVEVDASQLDLAILNICLNARDAMPEGGTITLAARNEKGPASAKNPSGDWVRISISDTGRGMTDEVKARAFEPFFTTKEVGKGSGLGLSQAYGFVQSAGGTIDIDSALGRGTTITIRLPATAARPVVMPPHTSAMRPGTQQGTILVIEDDLPLAVVTASLIEDAGYTVKLVHSGPEALEFLRSDLKRNIAAVFSDVVMPGGMNGFELARAIKAEFPGMPILLTSGYTKALSSSETEGVRVIGKPYDVNDMLAALANLVAKSTTVSS